VSVINDMLRDLDNRQALERSTDYDSVMESMIEPQKKRPAGMLIIIILVCILALVWSLWFVFFQNETVETKALPTVLPEVSGNTGHVLQPAQLSLSELEEEKPSVLNTELKASSSLGSDAVASPPAVKQPKVASSIIVVNKKKVGSVKAHKISEAKKATIVRKKMDHEKTDVEVTRKQPSSPANTGATPRKVKQTEPIVDSKAVLVDSSDSKPLLTVSLSPKALDQKMAEQAQLLFSNKERRQAYRALYDFIGAHEEDSKSRTVLAGELLQDGRMAEAGDVLVSSEISEHPKLRQMKARWLVSKGNHDLALHTLSSNLPELNQYPDYYVLLAAYYQRFGYAEKAIETYSQLVQLDENVADWWAGLAISSDSAKRGSQAKFAYQQALQLPGLNSQLVEFVTRRFNELK